MASGDPENITGGQIRAARAMLRITSEKLADMSGVVIATIKRAETLDGPVKMVPANVEVIRRALERAGIKFIPENGGGPGVRIRLRPRAKCQS